MLMEVFWNNPKPFLFKEFLISMKRVAPVFNGFPVR